MENEEITLKVNEVYQVKMQSRGAMGLQLMYRCDNESVVQVTRVESKSPTQPDMGGPVPAVFEIKGLKPGTAEIVFYETRPWEKDFKELSQKTIKVTVN